MAELRATGLPGDMLWDREQAEAALIRRADHLGQDCGKEQQCGSSL